MRAKHLLQILLLSAVWGVSFLMIRIAVVSFPPLWIALLRCALGAALMWTVLWLGRFKLPPLRAGPWLVLVALLNNAIPFTFFAWGERTVASNIAAVLNATVPVWTLLFSMLAHRARAAVRTLAGVLLAFAGVLTVVFGQAGAAALRGVGGMRGGIILIALAAVSYAVATLVAKSRLRGLDPMGLATTQLTLATVILLPVALVGEHPVALRAGPVGAVVVLGLAGSGVAYLLYYRLLAEISATQLMGVTYLMPLWGLFWGSFAGEPVGLLAWLGVSVTIAGLVLMNLAAPAAPALVDTAER